MSRLTDTQKILDYWRREAIRLADHVNQDYDRHEIELKEQRAELTNLHYKIRNELTTLLDDILTLEPQLKHHRTIDQWGQEGWDFERVHRAAEHLRNIDAAESVGYTDHSPDNVTYLHIVHTDPAA